LLQPIVVVVFVVLPFYLFSIAYLLFTT